MADWYFRNQQTGNIAACPGCGNLVRKDLEFCPYCARRLAPEKGVVGWLKRMRGIPDAATRVVIGVIVLFFILQLLTDFLIPHQNRPARSGGMFGLLASYPVTYGLLGSNWQSLVREYGQVWRFFTSCLLHFGIIHILFNCWAFWDLGRLAEKFWGAKQLIAVFILTGFCGSATSYLWHELILGRGTNSAGASGAVCGVLGLLLGTHWRNRFHIGDFLGSQLLRWAVYVVIFGLFAGADNAAHIGGMLSGAAFGFFLPPTGRSRRPELDAAIWNSLAAFSLLLAAICLGFMAVFYVVELSAMRSMA